MAQIQSPVPGTFYTKPSPDDAPFKTVGDTISVDDVIGLVEVMKTFIQIHSEVTGTFSGYAVEDSMPVTAGQKLAEVDAG
tara:strand:+ start:322 stop:561 length:240 start_codon:yes stop_codon:yes gene_type:complete